MPIARHRKINEVHEEFNVHNRSDRQLLVLFHSWLEGMGGQEDNGLE
jgi:hypothetical protein